MKSVVVLLLLLSAFVYWRQVLGAVAVGALILIAIGATCVVHMVQSGALPS